MPQTSWTVPDHGENAEILRVQESRSIEPGNLEPSAFPVAETGIPLYRLVLRCNLDFGVGHETTSDIP